MSEWTQPKDWSTDELVTAVMLNTHLRDNLNALKSPPTESILYDNGGLYSTNSTSLVVIDSTNLKCTVDTNGGAVMVFFQGSFRHGIGGLCSLDIRVDGTTWLGAGYDALINDRVESTYAYMVSLGPLLVEGLAAGQHTFEIGWKTGGGTVRLQSNSASGNNDENTRPIFWAREVS